MQGQYERANGRLIEVRQFTFGLILVSMILPFKKVSRGFSTWQTPNVLLSVNVAIQIEMGGIFSSEDHSTEGKLFIVGRSGAWNPSHSCSISSISREMLVLHIYKK